MSDDVAAAIPLEEAIEILSQPARAPSDDEPSRHRQILFSKVMDLLRDLGLEPAAEVVVPALMTLSPAGVGLLDLILALIDECDGVREAVEEFLTTLDSPDQPTTGAARTAAAAQRILIHPTQMLGAYLPTRVVELNDFRREELVRSWAGALGIPIASKGEVESAERSTRILQRLDYRKILIDEERFKVEQTVVSEQAAKVRALQERRRAAAMAAASRE